MIGAANAADASRWLDDAPLLPPEYVRELGPTLVAAPHPDDEALGCSGVVALLRRAGIPVRILVISDGAGSHLGSRAYPPPALAALRQSESLAGLACLGIAPEQVTFLGLPDGAVPAASSPGADTGIAAIGRALAGFPDIRTVLLPWRRDPHDDHRATWSLVMAALDGLPASVRRLEYPIWSLVHPGPDDLPRPGEATLWRLDIGPVVGQKRAAILAHRSQTTALIDDAEIGACLTAAVLERFFQPWECFIEVGR